MALALALALAFQWLSDIDSPSSKGMTTPLRLLFRPGHCGLLHNEKDNSILFGSFLPSLATILCHQQASRMHGDLLERNGEEAKAALE